MDRKLAIKWVKALRSGKYNQGKKALKVVNSDGRCSHCCLGVLREIEGLETNPDLSDNGRVTFYGPKNQNSAAYYVGSSLKSTLGDLFDGRISLAELNDGKDKKLGALSFDEIADLIQILWKEL